MLGTTPCRTFTNACAFQSASLLLGVQYIMEQCSLDAGQAAKAEDGTGFQTARKMRGVCLIG